MIRTATVRLQEFLCLNSDETCAGIGEASQGSDCLGSDRGASRLSSPDRGSEMTSSPWEPTAATLRGLTCFFL